MQIIELKNAILESFQENKNRLLSRFLFLYKVGCF